MKKLLFYLFFLGISNIVFSAPSKDSLLKVINSKIESLQRETEENGNKIQLIKEDSDRIDLSPSIAALIVCVITVLVNIWINNRIRKQSEVNLEMQIQSAERIALNNIRNSANLAEIEFNNKLKSSNRQEWINELRNNLAELSSRCKRLNIEYQSDESDLKIRKDYAEKLTQNLHKIFLLLNKGKEEHNDLEIAINILLKKLDNNYFVQRDEFGEFDNVAFFAATDNVIEQGRQVLYNEWKKAQEFN